MEKINAHVWSRYEDLLGTCLDIVLALDVISERQLSIMRMYFKERKTLDEIANDAGLSRERIRQVLDRGLNDLRLKKHAVIKEIPSLRQLRDNELPLMTRSLKRKDDKLLDIKKRINEVLSFEEVLFERNKKLEDVDMSVRLYNILKAAKINTLDDLANTPDHKLLRFRNAGKKTIIEAKDILFKHGF